MAGDRLLRILARLTSGSTTEPEPARLCEVCADVALMTGAGIMLMTGDTQQGSVCSSNEVSALIEELQFTLGEGPCVDAHRADRPVVEADLANPDMPRWLGFAPPAVAAGARAVFGFPMRVGGVRLGALNLYRDGPGPMSDDQYADALLQQGRDFSRKADGCESFEVFQRQDDPNKYMFLEQWASLEAHRENVATNVVASGHLAKIKALLTGPPDNGVVEAV